MSWELRLMDAMKRNGRNQDTRVLRGTIVNLNPIEFEMDIAPGFAFTAQSLESVTNGAYIGARVLLLQDVTTNPHSLYAIGKIAK